MQIFSTNTPATVDARISEKDQTALVESLQKLSVAGGETSTRVLRPGFGKAGNVIALRANFFAVKCPKDLILYEYPISISPEVKTIEKRTRRRILQLLELTEDWTPYAGLTANDGAQRIITRTRFEQQPFVVSVAYYEENQVGPKGDAKIYTIELDKPIVLKSSDLNLYVMSTALFAATLIDS